MRAGLIASFAFFAIYARCTPYKSPRTTAVRMLGDITLFITLLCAVMLKVDLVETAEWITAEMIERLLICTNVLCVAGPVVIDIGRVIWELNKSAAKELVKEAVKQGFRAVKQEQDSEQDLDTEEGERQEHEPEQEEAAEGDNIMEGPAFDLLAKQGKKLAIAKLAPLLKPLLAKQNLAWADVVPALDAVDSLEELTGALTGLSMPQLSVAHIAGPRCSRLCMTNAPHYGVRRSCPRVR